MLFSWQQLSSDSDACTAESINIISNYCALAMEKNSSQNLKIFLMSPAISCLRAEKVEASFCCIFGWHGHLTYVSHSSSITTRRRPLPCIIW